MQQNPYLTAALAAAARGWRVFPVVPAGKTPAIKGWQQQATSNQRQIRRWWRGFAMNIGVATGPSGPVVVDLDQSHGHTAPERFGDARHGLDVLARLAADAGADIPTNTYTVTTPGGLPLYYQAPEGVELRCTSGTLGWRIDTRAHGGYVVGAGSQRPDGPYQLARNASIAELPEWLVRALTPPPPPAPGPPMHLPPSRASVYVHAIVTGEARNVAAATTGTRHRTLLKAARTLGRLIGADELAENDARHVLLEAASLHIGVDNCTAEEVQKTIDDGITYGKHLPRQITSPTPPDGATAGTSPWKRSGPAGQRGARPPAM